MPDDYAASPQTTGRVAVGGSATGEIEVGGDRDWFAVTLEAGTRYEIDLEGSFTRAGTLRDPFLRGVHDANGNLIAGTVDDDEGTGLNSRLFFEPDSTGTHYVAAGASGGRTGTYRLSVTELVDDHRAGIGTTGTVAVGGSAMGEIERAGDRDWFAVTLEAGTRYRIDLEGSSTSAGTLRDPFLRGVHDANGNLIAGTVDDDEGTGLDSRLFFEPESTGTYYVAAGGAGSRTGTYRLSVTELVDDHPAGIGTTGTVAAGGSATGEIERAGDRDWFAVTLEAGTRYQIDLEGSSTSAGTLRDPFLGGVHDTNGDLIAGTVDDDEGTGLNSRLFFEPESTGTYYVAAGAFTDRTGTYRLSVTELVDDHRAGIGTTGTVAVGGSATGEIESPGDQDWFAVALEAGTRYRIDLEGSSARAGTLRDPYLRGVHDANGNLIAGTFDNNGGTWFDSRLVFEPESTGTHYVAAGAAGALTGTYRLSVTEHVDDHPTGVGTTGTVAAGRSATGEIEHAGDRDWFAVTLEAGTRYQIDLEGSSTGTGTLRDPYLRGVHDANGNLIARTTDDDEGTGLNSRLFFEPESTGTYYVAAGAYTDRTGTYRLSLTKLEDDHPAGTGTTGTVAVGGSAAGEIESPGDRDWFAVTLEAGTRYQIDLEGSPTSAGTLGNPHLHGVHDANGNAIAATSDDDGGTGLNSRLVFEPASTGTYYAAAGASGSGTGTYLLSVTELEDGDDYTANRHTSGTVAVGASATGELERAGDEDWFAVTLDAGKTYRIDLEGVPTRAGTLRDPYLRGVHDANGHRIATTDDDDAGVGLNSRVFFSPDSTGTYYIAAGANTGRSGTFHEIGTYRLSVTDADVLTDDYAADTGTTGTVAVGGSATGTIEVPGDHDWFAVTLELGKTYRIDLERAALNPTYTGVLSDPFLSNTYLHGVYDADGNLIAGTSDDDGGTRFNSRLVFEPASTGTYYVAARAFGNAETGTYRVSVTQYHGDDHTANTGTTGTVAVGGYATGNIERAGDQDWFAVTLEAGKTYRIDLKGSPTGAGTLGNPYLHGVHDANGIAIAATSDDDSGTGFNSRLVFAPASTGTYYVAADAVGGSTGTYRLFVTEDEGGDDYTANPQTTATVAVGGSATGEIEGAGDQDWFAVTLEAGRAYRIDLEGSPTGAGTLGNPYLDSVHDAHGDAVAATSDDDSGTGFNSRLFFEPASTGTYYVAARGSSGSTGTYRLSVTEYHGDDYTANRHTSGTVAAGDSATGEIERAGDQDWFAVTLEAGKTYRIDLEGARSNAGTLLNPYLHGVHDANGNRIAATSDDDGGTGLNSRFFFVPDSTGTYYVAAGAYGNRTGTYRVFVTEDEGGDDYTANPQTTGTVAVGGSATGNIERAGDQDWFAVTLQAGSAYWIDLEGSPTSAGTLGDTYLHGVHDADGNRIAGTSDDNRGTGLNSRLFFEPDSTGTYYVASRASGNAATGTYRVSVTEYLGGDDYTANRQTTGTVAVGGSATGEIERRGDKDWFAVTLEAGSAYQITVEATPYPGAYLRRVYDANGDGIAGAFDHLRGALAYSRVTFEPDSSGTYYIAAGADWNHTGAYRVSVTELDHEDDYSAGIGTDGTVSVGGSVTGEIDYRYDQDWFAVALQAGSGYWIDLEGAPTDAGTLSDPYIRGIYDADRNLIANTFNTDGGTGFNSRLYFEPGSTGTYYIAASDYVLNVGTYRLSVTEYVGGDDYPDGTDTTGRVAVDGHVRGEIETPRDVDWFRVGTLYADRTYRIDLEGSTLSNPYIPGVYDADGNLIEGTTDHDSGLDRNSRVLFVPDANGAYYIAVGGYRSGTGTYRLAVAETDPDLPADTDTPATVAVGGSTTGELEIQGDEDWIAVTLEADTSYRIDIEGLTLFNPHLRGVHDAHGNPIPDTTDGDGGLGLDSRLVFKPETAGTYYLAVGAQLTVDTGTYRVTVTEVGDDDDFTADNVTTATVAVGSYAWGDIERAHDQDWFAVTLETGARYQIDLEGVDTFSGSLSNPHIRGVHDADGNLIAGTTDADDGFGHNSRLIFESGNAGTYYIAAGASGTHTGTYRLSVTQLNPGDDYSANANRSGTLVVGGSATGEIEYAGDRDWFAVTLEADTGYRIDLEGSPTSAGTLRNPVLHGVYDADGNVIAATSDDDGGTDLNSRLFFEPASTGTFYVAAAAYGNLTGTYRLSVTAPGDDHPAGIGTTGTVAVGGSATGEVELPGDQDWFAVTLEAGTSYQIDLEGSRTSAGTLRNPYLRGVYDADGDPIAGTEDDDEGTGRNSRLVFEPESTGTFYVAAGGAGSHTGTYRLSVKEAGDYADDHTAGTRTKGTVAVGGSATGEIEVADDRDWFAVTLETGTRYRIDLEGTPTSAGTLDDPYLHGVYDADGNRIEGTEDDDEGTGLNSRLWFTPDSTGTFYLAAGSHASHTGTYRLSVTEAAIYADDYAADTGTSGTVTVGGSATGEIEVEGDQDWFAVTLEEDTRYRIDLEGAHTSAGTLRDPYLRGVYDANGNAIEGAEDDDEGTGLNSRLWFTPDSTGTFYLAAGAYVNATGTYAISVEETI